MISMVVLNPLSQGNGKMDVKKEQTIKVILTLSEKEAMWLKRYVQNPICAPENEPEEDLEMRRKLFEALS